MDILKALKKASGNEMASIMSEGTISDIKEYYDTGCLLLNAQITGSMFRGIPDCKTICYSGQSTSGKTFLVIETLKNFLNADKKNNYGIWFASEKAVTKDMLKNRGVDITRILYVPIGTVEDFNQQIWDELKEIQSIKDKCRKAKVEEPNFIFILDSLGQLGTVKDQKDLDKKEFKENMIRAKHVKKVFRDIELKLAYLRIPMLFTNHVYASTGSFISIDIIAGGGGVLYSADIIIAMRKAKLYEGSGDNKKVIGITMTCHSYKNRHALENTKIKLHIIYKSGLSKYSGLFDYCVENKLFKEIKSKKEDKKPVTDFDKLKDKKKKDKNKLYGFAIDENTLIKFTEKNTETRPEEIFTKPFLKQLDNELQPYFNYGNEYKDEPKKKPIADEDIKKNEVVKIENNKIKKAEIPTPPKARLIKEGVEKTKKSKKMKPDTKKKKCKKCGKMKLNTGLNFPTTKQICFTCLYKK